MEGPKDDGRKEVGVLTPTRPTAMMSSKAQKRQSKLGRAFVYVLPGHFSGQFGGVQRKLLGPLNPSNS